MARTRARLAHLVSPFVRSLLRASRATAAALLLGVFVLGAALHGLHHLQDPGCEEGVDHNGHACAVCSTLHGSTLVASEIAAPAPLPVAWVARAMAPESAPDHRPLLAAAPRAPPAS
jgi:hypothetical protein